MARVCAEQEVNALVSRKLAEWAQSNPIAQTISLTSKGWRASRNPDAIWHIIARQKKMAPLETPSNVAVAPPPFPNRVRFLIEKRTPKTIWLKSPKGESLQLTTDQLYDLSPYFESEHTKYEGAESFVWLPGDWAMPYL